MRWTEQIRQKIQNFSRDEKGFVMITFLLLVVPAIAFIGLIIDTQRAYAARDRLQFAAEQAALTAALYYEHSGGPQVRDKLAEDVLWANFNNSTMAFRDPTIRITAPGTRANEDRIFVEAQIHFDPTIMHIIEGVGASIIRVQGAARCTGVGVTRQCNIVNQTLPDDYL